MKIDKKMIAGLERLARIDLDDDAEERLAKQLERIIGYVEQLQEVDTEGVAPTSAVVHEDRPKLRRDEVRPGLDRDVILRQAPDAAKGFFRVPKIVER
jgi:aspartyl-tRNA(Asn)/glutamyl-tRNA(Gln) amidotransferase subunit C